MNRADLVVGIDVGGPKKGFHCVTYRSGKLVDRLQSGDVGEIAAWCVGQGARVVAVDAPIGWSSDGGSRHAERDVSVGGKRVRCFSTPMRDRAAGHPFYGWIFEAEKLYAALAKEFKKFDRSPVVEPTVVETFPHGVVCALAGKVVAAHPKRTTRLAVLIEAGYDVQGLISQDWIDSALCALAADRILRGELVAFGIPEEGFLVLPS